MIHDNLVPTPHHNILHGAQLLSTFFVLLDLLLVRKLQYYLVRRKEQVYLATSIFFQLLRVLVIVKELGQRRYSFHRRLILRSNDHQ